MISYSRMSICACAIAQLDAAAFNYLRTPPGAEREALLQKAKALIPEVDIDPSHAELYVKASVLTYGAIVKRSCTMQTSVT